MQLTIDDVSPVEKRVDFEVPWGDVAPRLDRAYSDLKRKVRLKGFRPGKAPRSVLEQMFKQQVESEVARDLIELSLGQAIQENQLEPVAPPRVDKLEMLKGEPFKFSATVEVRSEVEPKNYGGLELTRRPVSVADTAIDAEVQAYQRKLTQFEVPEGRTEVEGDDLVLVEMAGKVGPHKFKNRTGVVDLADENNAPLPGLAEHLKGMPADGETHEVRYTLPKDEKLRELAGQDVRLKVNIKEIRARKVPAVDDQLAKDTGEAETLEGLREKIRERLEQADEEAIQSELKSQAVKAIVEANAFPIAPSLVQRFAQSMVERFKVNLVMAGIEANAAGLDEQKMAEEFKDDAEQEARGSVLLAAIAAKEGVEVTDGDLQKRIAELAAARQESAKKVRADLDKAGRLAGLRRQIQDDKTLDLLLSQAKISEGEPERLIVTPEEARSEGQKLIVSPEEAAQDTQDSNE